MNKKILIKTVANLTLAPKGILAMDESTATAQVRFEKLKIPATEENRKNYRELLIMTPELEKYISGVILFDETIKQIAKNNKSFVSILKEKSIEIGIKVDQGLEDFKDHPKEKISNQGLNNLLQKIKEYKKMGASFAKWRVIYLISENTPSKDLIKINAEALAEYAIICQSENIVPIIEPEILLEGNYSIQKCYQVMADNFDFLFRELKVKDVFIPGIILKTGMVLSGQDAKNRASVLEVAEMTLKCLKEHVPENIGGIVFLSGGQGEEEVLNNLNQMHKTGNLPWPLTFSYSRAIQNKVLEYWAKNNDDISGAQKLLLQIAEKNSLASIGKYKD